MYACVVFILYVQERMTMKPFVFWFLTLVLWAVEATQGTSDSDLDLCQEGEPTLQLYNRTSVGQTYLDDEEMFCFLYPEKTFRCTMPRHYLHRGSWLSVIVWVDKTGILPECSPEAVRPSEEPGDVATVVECLLMDLNFSSLTVLLNVSGQDTHAVYCHKFSFELMEVLPPPPDISPEVKGGHLLVSWGLPYSHSSSVASCFDYQLDVNQQVNEIKETNHLEMSVDPAGSYAVRMRTRKSPNCLGSEEWSAWSHVIAVPPTGSLYHLNYVVIVSILLGTPMIILALLLVLRRPRVSKLLFPQIPQPPMKYKHFLKTHTSINFLPVAPTAQEEEITVVEDTQR